MKSLARLSVRHRWYILSVWILLFVGVTIAAQNFGSSYTNIFTLPGTNSAHAYALLAKVKGQSGDTDQIVFQTTTGTVIDQQSKIQAMLDKVSKLAEVASVTSPFCSSVSTPCVDSTQVSKDHTIAYAVVHFTTQGFNLKNSQIKSVETVGSSIRSSSLTVQFGGNAFGQLESPPGSSSEMFGLLATAMVLFFAFGSFYAMLLPLGVALFALGVASGTTTLLSHSLAIATFAPILGSLIGLGVGIDYALFIVTRSRQGMKRGLSVEDSIVNAINTSGRAVLFAGCTVCIALLGMMVMRLSFLNGVAIATTITVAITMLASLTLLPSLLAMPKHRVLSRRERRNLAADGPEPLVIKGGWHRWSLFVSRHPRSLSAVAMIAIVMIASPFFSLHLGSSDQGSDPASATTRQAYDLLAKGFGPGFNGPLTVVGTIKSPADLTALKTLDRSLVEKNDVAAVSPVYPEAHGTVGVFSVVPKSSPQDSATSNLISSLRNTYIPAATGPSHAAIYVGSITAIDDDFANVLAGKLPLFVGVIVLLGCLLLMVAFRSIVIPLVAAAMNLLAAGAAFGLVVAVFQWGWGSSLLGAGTGPIESYMPIIMIAVLFGLSMDYQVFLVSRMHEEWLNTNDNEQAIIRGQANTGRVITAAALVMISVFASFSFGGQRTIAEFGIGLGGAVLIDAFILRTVLVPSLMHLIGNANWWMPKVLNRVIPHVAVEATNDDLVDACSAMRASV